MLNDAPILPEEDEEDTMSLLKDSPQCVAFGLFMIWSVSRQKEKHDEFQNFRFSSITINLGPTFLSGALAANADDHIHEPSCPLVQVETCSTNHVYAHNIYAGPISTLHPKCPLDLDQPPLCHVDLVPAPQTLQRFHHKES